MSTTTFRESLSQAGRDFRAAGREIDDLRRRAGSNVENGVKKAASSIKEALSDLNEARKKHARPVDVFVESNGS